MTVVLREFRVNKTFFSDILLDPNIKMGIECEFMVRNASDLLEDEEGYLPHDFETYNLYDLSAAKVHDAPKNLSQDYNVITTQVKLSRLFEKYLGLPENEIELGGEDNATGYAPGLAYYKHWKIEVDYSLFPKRKSLENEDNDAGIELVSPVYGLKDGLMMLSKILDMIQNFRHENVSLYTTIRTGLHINLSHSNMAGGGFDFAKVAILGGDEHYLKAFSRDRNLYAKSLLPFVYNELIAAKEGHTTQSPQKQQAANNMLKLRGWNAARVMKDLSDIIPMSHYMSIDFQRLSTNNPYIEIRIAGNKFYQKRYDEVATMTMRFAGLIKIACEPDSYRQEYLKAIYKLVSSAVPVSAERMGELPSPTDKKNPFLTIKLYFRPIMNPVVRRNIDLLERMYLADTLTVLTGQYLFLGIIRNALDLRQANTQRIRQGLNIIMTKILHTDPQSLIKIMGYQGELRKYGILRPQDTKPNQIILGLTNYIKSLTAMVPIKTMK